MSDVSDAPNSSADQEQPIGTSFEAISPAITGSRRIPLTIAAPIVLGCALIGATIGLLQPLHQATSAAGPKATRDKAIDEAADLRLATFQPVNDGPVATQPTVPIDPNISDQPGPLIGGNVERKANVSSDAPAPLAPAVPAEEQPKVTAPSAVDHAPPAVPSSVASVVATGSVDPPSSPLESREIEAPRVTEPRETTRADVRSRVAAHNHRIARAKRLRRLTARHPSVNPPTSEVGAFFSSLLTK